MHDSICSKTVAVSGSLSRRFWLLHSVRSNLSIPCQCYYSAKATVRLPLSLEKYKSNRNTTISVYYRMKDLYQSSLLMLNGKVVESFIEAINDNAKWPKDIPNDSISPWEWIMLLGYQSTIRLSRRRGSHTILWEEDSHKLLGEVLIWSFFDDMLARSCLWPIKGRQRLLRGFTSARGVKMVRSIYNAYA